MKYAIAALIMLCAGAVNAEEQPLAAPYLATKPVECYPAPVLKASLEQQYSEEQVFSGVGKARGVEGMMNVVVMLYLNTDNNTFTVVELQEHGFACVLGAGDILSIGNMQGIKVRY
jgi:hypothetical protein